MGPVRTHVDDAQAQPERSTTTRSAAPSGPFWAVEPAEGGHQAFFVEDDPPTARVVLLGANMRFCD
jgi:hypothetical protein